MSPTALSALPQHMAGPLSSEELLLHAGSGSHVSLLTSHIPTSLGTFVPFLQCRKLRFREATPQEGLTSGLPGSSLLGPGSQRRAPSSGETWLKAQPPSLIITTARLRKPWPLPKPSKGPGAGAGPHLHPCKPVSLTPARAGSAPASVPREPEVCSSPTATSHGVT